MSSNPFELHDESPVYVISVAAELTGLHPQTLRQYDRLGLVSPGRSTGRGRRYSARDIAVLREVARLSAEGVGLVGIKRILELEAHVDALQRQVVELQARLSSTTTNQAPASVRPRTSHGSVSVGRNGGIGPGRDVVPARTDSAIVVWTRTQQ
jgi:MerR family transcriptional regulator/heat shock protein HspR